MKSCQALMTVQYSSCWACKFFFIRDFKMGNSSLIGIISDTHDNRPLIRKAVKILTKRKIDHLIHAGDFISPFTAADFSGLSCPFTGVFGNNDGERLGIAKAYLSLGNVHSVSTELNICERKIYIRHEPDAVEVIAKSQEYDVVVYGHTHKIDIRKIGKSLLINPGECCGWVTGNATVFVVNLMSLEVEKILL